MSSSLRSNHSSKGSEPAWDRAAAGQLHESLYWLIRLRWLAACGVLITAFFSSRFLGLTLPYAAIYGIAVSLAAVNSIFFLFMRRAGTRPVLLNRLANLQIPVDLAALATLLHLSGGAENPFSFYFVFHMIIASVLLSRRATWLQAHFAVALFISMVWLEHSGVIPHHCFAPWDCSASDWVRQAGISAAFVSTMYIAVYMTSSMALRLRQKEESLREANQQLNEKDKVKSNYVLRVTHDLKEHLAAIQACLDPVLEGIVGPLAEPQERMVRRAYDRTGKLMFFVRALLEITRIKLSRRMETAPFSLRKAALSAVSLVEARARARDISLSWSIEPGIDIMTGARIYIEETIANFLANAVKYTPPGGKVELMIGDAGASVLIRVKDTGIGIPRADQPRLFEEFFRASNAKEMEPTGTGLGLSIAKEVIQRHSGRVWVESEENKGSSFYFSLPKSLFRQ